MRRPHTVTVEALQDFTHESIIASGPMRQPDTRKRLTMYIAIRADGTPHAHYKVARVTFNNTLHPDTEVAYAGSLLSEAVEAYNDLP